jgi:uncharacterized glyoxalase superfamily protein PhnB
MSTSVNETTKMELEPYIFFYGRSQEALDFYKGVLGGSYEATPHEGGAKVMHASFTAPGDRVFAALSQGGKVVMPLDDAAWGGRFGVIHDRFGLEWMVTAP